MLKIFRHISAVFLLIAGAQAQELAGDEPSGGRNRFFFHPIITGLSLAIDEVPLLLAFTYERELAGNGTSFVYQPQIALGSQSIDDVDVNQFSLSNILGVRKYFSGVHQGWYIQGSGALAFGAVSAEQDGNPNEASATMFGFGGLAYLGYKWTHVFFDIGGGFQAASGTLEFDDGEEVEVSATGPALDLNLGFGF